MNQTLNAPTITPRTREKDEAKPRTVVIGAARPRQRFVIPGVPSAFERLGRPLGALRELHNASAGEVAERVSSHTERIIAETTGALTGGVRAATGLVLGLASGIVRGAPAGVSPSHVKELRMQQGTLHEIGEWVKTEEREIITDAGHPATGNFLVAHLKEDLDGTPMNMADDALLLLNGARRSSRVIDGEPHEVVIIPVYAETSGRVRGFVVASETNRKIYVWRE